MGSEMCIRDSKYPVEAVPKDIQNVLDEVNKLQRRLTQAEQHNRLMRESKMTTMSSRRIDLQNRLPLHPFCDQDYRHATPCSRFKTESRGACWPLKS